MKQTPEQAAEDFVWEVMENDEDGISELSRKLRPSSKISDFYDALAEFFKAGAEFIIKQIEDFISKHTYNAHDISNDNPEKQYYQGKDDAYCEILNLLKEINNGKQQT